MCSSTLHHPTTTTIWLIIWRLDSQAHHREGLKVKGLNRDRIKGIRVVTKDHRFGLGQIKMAAA